MTHPIRLVNASAIRAVGGLVLTLLCGAFPVTAQIVRPVIVEHKGKVVRGKIELVNDGVVPMTVVSEAKSFLATGEGELSFQPLDRNLQVKLSAMGARIPPQQTQILFYEARAETLPAWFVIYSTFALKPPDTGITVQIQLPHVVYLNQEQPLQQQDIEVTVAGFDSPSGKLSLVVQNSSPRLGRLQEVTLSNPKEKKIYGGFPLFPQYKRHVDLPWEPEQPPTKIVLRFEKFRVEQEVPQALLARRD
ncbi:MAG: hypothetical protein ACRD88_00140 [Terriglobia bacterium]